MPQIMTASAVVFGWNRNECNKYSKFNTILFESITHLACTYTTAEPGQHKCAATTHLRDSAQRRCETIFFVWDIGVKKRAPLEVMLGGAMRASAVIRRSSNLKRATFSAELLRRLPLPVADRPHRGQHIQTLCAFFRRCQRRALSI